MSNRPTQDTRAGTPGRQPDDGPQELFIQGAREHNLRDIDIRIPRDQLVVITGPSGSGKSSLAFDTVYAEGQRRYVESLSTYGRLFLDQMKKPDVDAIEGLSPAIAIEQKSTSSSPRSTVGTVTEVYDYLRLLFARAGTPHCPQCDRPISSQTLEDMCEKVMGLGDGTRVGLLAPVVRGRKGAYRKELESFRKQGFVRVRIDGETYDLGQEIQLRRQARHDIDVVVDRIVVSQRVRPRIEESLSAALELADGLVRLDTGGEDSPQLLSRSSACPDCGLSLPEASPRLFSFNSPQGACRSCSGLGEVSTFDPKRIVPNSALSLRDGAIDPWQGRRGATHYAKLVDSLSRHFAIDTATPWHELPEAARHGILHGTGEEPIAFEFEDGAAGATRRWDGVVGELARRESSGGPSARGLDRYRSAQRCASCDGSRLSAEARHVRLREQSIDQLSAYPISELRSFLEDASSRDDSSIVIQRIVAEIRDRLEFLEDVGLHYLSLDRASASLSGGEAQRIRLATQIGSSLMGVLYILDEPSIGLHPRDNKRLLESLVKLRDMGNSVLVVEHDEETIRSADHVIDMGPGAGIHGGRVVAQGSPEALSDDPHSLTGAFLSGRRKIALRANRRRPDGREIALLGCSEHNLKSLNLRIPVGLFTVVTGVSGSGKSTLIRNTLHRVLAQELHGGTARPGRFESGSGLDQIDKVIAVDQSPIGRSPRSNPITYTGAFDGIRRLFSGVPESRIRGYKPGRFSFNVKGGRCEACQGNGQLRIEMNFLPDLFVPCRSCDGNRFEAETLEILYRGKSIADVLEMTAEEGLLFFENVGAVHRPLKALCDVGLHYLKLGQAAHTLSGGEAQRIQLARELARRHTGRTLYLLDEPTTGLHLSDVETLLALLQRVVDLGNTVVVIEHHLDVIKLADHVIDLGPEGGADGGEIVACGTPEEISNQSRSYTGAALKDALARAN